MKRVLAIVAIVLSVATVVGVFIVAGGDGASEAKGSSTSTTVKVNPVKAGADAIANAGAKVQSGGPVTTQDDDDDDDDDDNGKYEAKAPFVGASPSTAQVGKKVELRLRNFAPKSKVMVTISTGQGTPVAKELTTDKQGRAKWEFKAGPQGTYVVTAVGTGSKSATTTLKVVAKKS